MCSLTYEFKFFTYIYFPWTDLLTLSEVDADVIYGATVWVSASLILLLLFFYYKFTFDSSLCVSREIADIFTTGGCNPHYKTCRSYSLRVTALPNTWYALCNHLKRIWSTLSNGLKHVLSLSQFMALGCHCANLSLYALCIAAALAFIGTPRIS